MFCGRARSATEPVTSTFHSYPLSPKTGNPEGMALWIDKRQSPARACGRVGRTPVGARCALQSACLSAQRERVLLCLSSSWKCQDPWVPAHVPTSWPWAWPLTRSLCHPETSFYTALANECFYLGGATHLFFPFVTHSSATWRRSETLRDRPSPVVPFTVPNKESVSGTNQQLSLLQCQHCKCRVRNTCLGGKDMEKHRRIEAGRGNAMSACLPQA